MNKARVLIVIPTLNEELYISNVLDSLSKFCADYDAPIIVVDGGSTDQTRRIVEESAAINPRIVLMDNPDRLQSAAVNLAVRVYGDSYDILIRMDAHAVYPADYCSVLIEEAEATLAASVVTRMHAVGHSGMQLIIATAQNSTFGNGGSPHRNKTNGQWVEHGHHALMRMEAFKAVDGYDASFSHNEDAELDYRLRKAGYRIWLTCRTEVTYFPRRTVQSLFKQYFKFGQGRARTLTKLCIRPAARQILAAALAPALLSSILVPMELIAVSPLAFWLCACFAMGLFRFFKTARINDLFVGFFAGVMQLAWSMGYWSQKIYWRSKSNG
ncbi:glycosyltransferase family 2 protein [Donghicola sp. C2-DW-16]|uniref:Glycosyltransferase family 2 protein n=1 Tax=Donghicola mangrovi TaxID=2729614 RepID=A0ABX2PJZ0_9RHOB|nr:glycosyltransferase family 2 protein [Donghicola mangrovi]NVO29196.1 glycosyltransferase family 2 protein [Donghicola mangrovi]